MSFYLLFIFFLPDTDIIMTLLLLQYFVCCITQSFQLWR